MGKHRDTGTELFQGAMAALVRENQSLCFKTRDHEGDPAKRRRYDRPYKSSKDTHSSQHFEVRHKCVTFLSLLSDPASGASARWPLKSARAA
jgi:hypothetical protein